MVDDDRLRLLVGELRVAADVAAHALAALRAVGPALDASTSAEVSRVVSGLRQQIDQTLAGVCDARDACGTGATGERIALRELLTPSSARVAVHERPDVRWTVAFEDDVGDLDVDRGRLSLLAAAVDHLVANAFRFTLPDGHVSLDVRVSDGQLVIDIADGSGGFPAAPEGAGVGLATCRKAIASAGGQLRRQTAAAHGETVGATPSGPGSVFTVLVPVVTLRT